MPPSNQAWPDCANEFAMRYAALEKELKLAGIVKRGRRDAQADWGPLSISLGDAFFQEVVKTGKAVDLFQEPPRTRMADSLAFEPEQQEAISNVTELFSWGVCKVRNNLIHGEKFDVSGYGWERDERLVSQALWVLKQALERATQPGALLTRRSGSAIASRV